MIRCNPVPHQAKNALNVRNHISYVCRSVVNKVKAQENCDTKDLEEFFVDSVEPRIENGQVFADNEVGCSRKLYSNLN